MAKKKTKSKKRGKNSSRKKRVCLKETKAYQQTQELQKNIRNHLVVAIVTALGFVIALYWKDIATEGVDLIIQTLNLRNDTYLLKVFAAIIVTLICVIGIFVVSRWEIKDA